MSRVDEIQGQIRMYKEDLRHVRENTPKGSPSVNLEEQKILDELEKLQNELADLLD